MSPTPPGLKPLSPSRWDYFAAAHLLNRAGFGGPPEEIERLVRMGHEQAVNSLIDYDQILENFPDPDWAKPDPTRPERFRLLQTASEEERRRIRRENQRLQRQHLFELRGWWLNRMAKTPRPLQEKLTLFWHGHFATSVEKVKDTYLMWLQNDTFRRHAASSWPVLLHAVARDPAMLIWLDQAESRKEHPNENFARELMELFTLGEGSYTEKDVMEAARALTGWSVQRITQQYLYRPLFHDEGSKTVLGLQGNLTGEQLLGRINSLPQAARFITAKLWRYFVSEELSQELHEELTALFQAGKQEFRPFLRAIFRSEAFYDPAVIRSQVKGPVQWLVGSVRILQRPLPGPLIAARLTRALGQDLFAPPNVKGWDGGLSWITTNTLLNRYNFAAALVLDDASFTPSATHPRMRAIQQRRRSEAGRPSPVDPRVLVPRQDRRQPGAVLTALEKRLLQGQLKPQSARPIREFLEARKEITDDAVLQAARMVMTTPEFQLT